MIKNDLNRKAVVTGGAGFIGSHIVDELIDRGWLVTVIDDLSSGNLNNLRHLFDADKNPDWENRFITHNSHFEFIRGSIVDLPLLQKHLAGAELVFHEAAIASVPHSIKEPFATHEINLTGSLNVLLAARDNRVKKVVCASSAAVYGNSENVSCRSQSQDFLESKDRNEIDPLSIPRREDMLPNPQSPYAVNKLAMEYYCRVFSSVFNLPTVCLRYFNVYGTRQNPNSDYAAVIPKFIQRVEKGLPPIIYGDGEQSRDFVYVKDVVSANLLAAEQEVSGIFNIGTGQKINVNQLAQIIIDLQKCANLHPIYENERPGDIKHSFADISSASAFGFKPQYDLREGLKNLIG